MVRSERALPVVRVEPLGLDLAVKPGETVLAAAYRHGYTWPTLCYGSAACCMCVMDVTAGAEHLGPATRLEQLVLTQLTESDPLPVDRRLADRRLACRATVVEPGAIVVCQGVTRNGPRR